jgi:IS5 family transposase
VPRAHRIHGLAALGLPQNVDNLLLTESALSHVLLLSLFAAELQECHVQLLGVRSEALYDSQASRGFARIDLSADGLPDATALLKFRRLLETHDLGRGPFSAINTDLAARGLLLREGALVDATIIAAPPSTKNKGKKHDPEMHQIKKRKQWHFEMKAHIGAGGDSKLVQTVVVTTANLADITKTAQLPHRQEKQVHADAAYTGVEKRAKIVASERKMDWQIARKRGSVKTTAEGAEKETLKAVEKAKASVRAFIEHPFHIIKNIFRHRKVRYRGRPSTGINSTRSSDWPT